MSRLKDIINKTITTKTDPDELTPIIRRVLISNASLAKQYKAGNKKVFGRLMKEAFEATLDGANPELTKKIIEVLLNDK